MTTSRKDTDHLRLSHVRDTAAMRAAPRCGARTRRGTPCQAPAVRGGRRCRMHGGTGSGPPAGNRNAWKHGGYTRAEIARRRRLGRMVRDMKAHLAALSSGLSGEGRYARPKAPGIVPASALGATVHGVVSPKGTTANSGQKLGGPAKSCGANGQSPYIESGCRNRARSRSNRSIDVLPQKRGTNGGSE